MPPSLFRPTIYLLAAVVGLCTVYDLWAVSQHYEWTISANLWEIARNTNAGPPLCFVAGFLTGHTIFVNRAARAQPAGGA